MADEIDRKTQETAKRLFGGGVKMDPPYRRWNLLFLYKLLKDMIYGKAQKMWRYTETIEYMVGR